MIEWYDRFALYSLWIMVLCHNLQGILSNAKNICTH
jgi:hypothetical protein